ncbi:hypothetical protein [Burkholderia cepacia]|uniref:hypothetical protein n=1 Tax=Burkholderia cepacia TaxID=292 RepID=UPI0012D97FAB|nr:hypothetical protein [Burkholderia cepacia]
MATRYCFDCDFPLEETACHCPACGSKDPFGTQENLWLIAAVSIMLSTFIGSVAVVILFYLL